MSCLEGSSRGMHHDSGPGGARSSRNLEESVPAELTEEGARQEAGGREATATRGHDRGGRGCGHPPMTLPGPRDLSKAETRGGSR